MSTETLAGGNKFTTSGSGLVWDTVGVGKSIQYKSNGTTRATVSDNGLALASPLATSSGGTGVTSLSSTPAANSIAVYDSSVNLSANNFAKPLTETTITINHTTVLTAESTQIQRFRGSAASTVIETVQLPDTTALNAGFSFIIVNDSTSTIQVYNTLSGTLVETLLPKARGGTVVAECIFTGTANTWVASHSVPLDYNNNAEINNVMQGFSSYDTTSVTSTVLTEASTYFSYIYASGAAQAFEVTLPDATTLANGQRFAILNGMTSTGVTIKRSNGVSLLSMVGMSDAQVIVVNNTINTASSWKYLYSLTSSTGTVSSVDATTTGAPFLSVTGGPITSTGSLDFSYSGTALPIANGGTGATEASGTVASNTYTSYDANSEVTAFNFITGRSIFSASPGVTTAGSFSSPVTIADLATAYKVLSTNVADTNYYARQVIYINGLNTYGSGGSSYYKLQMPDLTGFPGGRSYRIYNSMTNGSVDIYDFAGTNFITSAKVQDVVDIIYTGATWPWKVLRPPQMLSNSAGSAVNLNSSTSQNLTANRLWDSATSINTSAGTATLLDTTQGLVRVTGSTTGFVYALPDATLTAVNPTGSKWTLYNESSVTFEVVAYSATPTAGVLSVYIQKPGEFVTYTKIASTNVAASWAVKATPASYINGFTSTPFSSGGTLTLSRTSNRTQLIAESGGTAGQIHTVKLPSTYAAGTSFKIVNDCTVSDVDVQTGAGTAIVTLLAGTSSVFLGPVADSTSSGSWKVTYDNLDQKSSVGNSWTPTIYATTSSSYTSQTGSYSTMVAGTTPSVVSQMVKCTGKIVMAGSSAYEAGAASTQLLNLLLPVVAGANQYTSIKCWQGDITTPTNGFTTHDCPVTITSGSAVASVVCNFTPADNDIWHIDLLYRGVNLVS